MIYRIRERFWSLGDNFTINNESDEACFQVKGEVFSWGDSLSFQDASGSELAVIDQKLLTLMPRYQILIDGAVFAEVVKEWSWFSKSFTLDVPGPNDYSIEGSFWEHDFTFNRKGRIVAHVNKHMLSFSDSYGVEIIEGEDVVAILCTCIVIDQILHDEKD